MCRSDIYGADHPFNIRMSLFHARCNQGAGTVCVSVFTIFGFYYTAHLCLLLWLKTRD